jgi:hypothetical protein
MRSSPLILAAAAVLITGCGSDKASNAADTSATAAAVATATAPSASTPEQPVATAPVQAPATTTNSQPPTPAPASAPLDAQFCTGAPGKALAKAAKAATTAFNTADTSAFSTIVDQSLEISKDAPPGSACVKDELNGLAALALNAKGILKIDPKATVAKIQKFEDEHQIEHPTY